jgi:hypothetical protein
MRGIYRNAAHGEKKLLGILDSGMLQLFVFARLGAQGRNRTTDTAIFSRMLYQLSYLGAAGI